MTMALVGKRHLEQDAKATYARFVALRDEIDAGRRGWAELADFFTEDAVYVDPAWGRQEGRDVIRRFFVESMAGLTGNGWSSPERWTMCDGHRLVSQWDQVLGPKADGGEWVVPGLSILYYAGNGLFCYSHDMLNMTHVGETLKQMAWQPPANFNLPPRHPNRCADLPAAWVHLANVDQ